jgi:glycosyltransferase involved in cell wall biosynthesis
MPIYNDWNALSLLLPKLDQELNTHNLLATIILVDDCSTIAVPRNLSPKDFKAIENIDVLSLRRNVGHQRAIATGLCYIAAKIACCRYVVIMDADGEDDPRDVPALVRECIAHDGNKIIFAARLRRSESLVFKCFYNLYRLVHFLLTGIKVRVGNFSVVPVASLQHLIAVSELWNHYAAAVHKAKLPLKLMPTRRGSRLAGSSHMDIVALFVHGFSAMAVFGDRIGVRLIILFSLGILLDLVVLVGIIVIKLFTTSALPGWATYTTGLLLVILIQMFLVVLSYAFIILASRETMNFIPSRDYIHIAGKIRRVYAQKTPA